MTKIKELSSNNKHLATSLIEFLKFLDPSGKSKYVDLMSRISIKPKLDYEKSHEKRIKDYFSDLGIVKERLNNYTVEELTIFNRFFDMFVSHSEYKLILDLYELHERKFTNVDVNTIKTYEDLSNIVTLHSVKKYLKESEKSINILYKDDNWILLKPLSHASSLKYGAGTKWCTASRDNYQFYRYSKNGILIYIVNLQTGNKYGFFHSLVDIDTSFWNVLDNRVDSMETEIDSYVLNIIKNEIKSNKTPNWDYFSEQEKIQYQEGIIQPEEIREVDVAEPYVEVPESTYVYQTTIIPQ
jgi:hypothetical protein